MLSLPLRYANPTRLRVVAHTGIRRVVPLSTVCAVVMAIAVGGSSAALVTRAETPSKEWVVDGSVMALAATKDALYVGGDFTAIGPPTGAWVSVDATGAVAPVRSEVWAASRTRSRTVPEVGSFRARSRASAVSTTPGSLI